MPGPGIHSSAVPASYRLLLSISLAILAHTLVLAGFPSPLKDARDLSHRLVFTLTSPATIPTPESEENQTLTKSRYTEPEPPRAEPVVTSTESASSVSPETQTIAEQQPDTPNQKTETTAAPGTTVESSSSPAPTTVRASEPTETPETIKQITESPTETDSYLIRLATHLAEKLDNKRVPAISALTERVSMELELSLMPNGALTRARVIKSTGIQSIDEAAYRAALAASPYPSPEGEASGRFEVELVFSPKPGHIRKEISGFRLPHSILHHLRQLATF